MLSRGCAAKSFHCLMIARSCSVSIVEYLVRFDGFSARVRPTVTLVNADPEHVATRPCPVGSLTDIADSGDSDLNNSLRERVVKSKGQHKGWDP